MPDFNNKIRPILIFFLTVVFSVIFFEIYFRLTEIILPSFVYDDPELGRTHKAGSLVNLVGAEGFYMGKINSYGYPAKEYKPQKSDNIFRIALIGDSYVEGFQLFERHHFARLLEKEFNKDSTKIIEILNFGTGGADFRGMYLRHIKIAKKFNPDLTLYFIKKEDLINKDAIPMPEPVLKADSIVFMPLKADKFDSKIRQSFAFVREYSTGNLFKEVFETIYTGRLPEVIFDKFYPDKILSSKNNLDSDSELEDKFYSFNEKIIETLSKLNQTGSKIILVEVEELPEKYINLIKAYNLETIPLYKELKKHSKYELNYWKASGKIGHWNHKAHILISKFLLKYLINYRQD